MKTEMPAESGTIAAPPADETRSGRPRSADALAHKELQSILQDLKEARGYLNINLNLYPLRHLTLRDWQERFDRAITRLEQFVQDR